MGETYGFAASKTHLATFLSPSCRLFGVAPMCLPKMAGGKQTKSHVSGAAVLCFGLFVRNQGKKKNNKRQTNPSIH